MAVLMPFSHFLRRLSKPVHLGVHLNLNGVFTRLCSPDWMPIEDHVERTCDETRVTCTRCLELMEKYGNPLEQAFSATHSHPRPG